MQVAHPQSGSSSTWFLVELGIWKCWFLRRGETGVPREKTLSQSREPTTNLTHIWRRHQDLNPGRIGGRRVLSPLRHPCSPQEERSRRVLSAEADNTLRDLHNSSQVMKAKFNDCFIIHSKHLLFIQNNS